MSVKLTRVTVHKLFKKYDYEFDLNNSYDISILIAPNGCGKTTIFNFLDFMLNPSAAGYEKIQHIPFDVFTCNLSNETRLRLMPAKEGLSFNIDDKEANAEITINPDTVKNILDFLLTDKESLKNDENYKNKLMELKKKNKDIYKFKDSFKKLVAGLHVNYIPANRLFAVKKSGEAEDLTLKKNEEIKSKFAHVYDKYNKLQSKAKDEIINRFLNVENEDNTNCLNIDKDIKAEWKNYIKNVNSFRTLGLIDSTYKKANEMLKKAEADKMKMAFLNIYIEEFAKTLKPVKDFYKKLKLFTDILNKLYRITGKSFSFSKDKGVILNVDGRPLDLQFMSSGEKNDFVMFYNLIFDSEDGGLVLIDEPEISLHIEWQEMFLDSMQKICEMNGLQAIVATHSPHIINGRFELLIDYGWENNNE